MTLLIWVTTHKVWHTTSICRREAPIAGVFVVGGPIERLESVTSPSPQVFVQVCPHTVVALQAERATPRGPCRRFYRRSGRVCRLYRGFHRFGPQGMIPTVVLSTKPRRSGGPWKVTHSPIFPLVGGAERFRKYSLPRVD